jgi:solute carrier family 35 protein
MRDSKGSAQTPLLPKALEPSQDEASNAIPFIIYYALCSGTMLVINKLAIYYTQSPTFLLLCQLAFTAFVVQLLAVLGFVKSDHLEWDKTKKFIPVAMGFAASVFANMKVLQYANVDTFITFRSSTPLILSICDYLFLGRQLPSLRSWLCLLTLLISSVGYVMVDSAFEVRAYIWLLVWYAAFTFDGVYVKHLCNTVKMTDWGRVYYTNLLSLVPLVILYVGLKEYIILEHIKWQGPQLCWVIVACLLGVAMSHSGYCLRRSVTATMMALVGIICKVRSACSHPSRLCDVCCRHGSHPAGCDVCCPSWNATVVPRVLCSIVISIPAHCWC